MINTSMNLNPYENWEIYAKMCQDDPYEDIINESYELEARRILDEIQRRKKDRVANKIIVWLKEGF